MFIRSYCLSLLILLYYGYLYLPFTYQSSFQEINAKVLQVIDGDTLIFQRKGERSSLRLLYIDAPEKSQKYKGIPYGQMARKYLEDLLLHKMVKIKLLRDRDRYQRYLGQVSFKGQDINLLMIQTGQAFIYPFAKFENPLQKWSYLGALLKAQMRMKGFWKHHKLLSPYQYRKINVKKSKG